MWFKTKLEDVGREEGWNNYIKERELFENHYEGKWVGTKLGVGIILKAYAETEYPNIIGVERVRVFDIDVAEFYEYKFDEIELLNPSETEKAELKKRYLATLREHHLKDKRVYNCNCD